MWPEIPPVEPFERGIEELTGARPYKGTLMYYRQLGVYDPYETAQAPDPYPGQRTSDLIYYLEQSHHEAQPARHQTNHTLQGQRFVTHNAPDSFRQQAPRRAGKPKRHQVRPDESRELVGPPRPGRATELYQQGRVRADHHVVDETNVCPVPPRSQYKPGPRFTLKKSPWSAACESSFGDPRDAFEEVTPPKPERLPRHTPAVARQQPPTHPVQPSPGYIEMDYAHAPSRGGGHPHQQQPVKSSSTWKGGMTQPGQSFKRFHAGVVPYETDFNRKATGWKSYYVHEDPTDFIFAHDDLDSWKSPSFGSGGGGGGGGGGGHPAQYGDYNPRPKSWQTTGQEEGEEPFVPLHQRRSTFEQREQHHYQSHQQQRHPGQAPRPGRGSAAQRQDYAGPRTWGGGLLESDEL